LKLKNIKQEFIHALSGLYPSEEIQSFFSILSEAYLGLSRIDIALQAEKEITEENSEKFNKAILRLKEFEPIQYIIGETEFYGLPFFVNKEVLIPRPETEELVAWIVKENRENREERKDLLIANEKSKTILDIGTGSGCIAVSLAYNLPSVKVSALDISLGALSIAKQNAKRNKTSVNFIKADVLNIDDGFFKEEFDVIVSNPPYVRELEKSQIEPNVIKFEPATALFVKDDDPLLFYRKIAQLSQKYLKPDGALYFEINEYLSKELIIMLNTEGFTDVVLKEDIFGKARMIKCRRDE